MAVTLGELCSKKKYLTDIAICEGFIVKKRISLNGNLCTLEDLNYTLKHNDFITINYVDINTIKVIYYNKLSLSLISKEIRRILKWLCKFGKT